MEKISVILPARNELENLKFLIPAISQELAGCSHEIIVVDDDSHDGSESFFLNCDNVRLRYLRRTDRSGLGSAVGEGIEIAGGDILVIMDSDFNHSPDGLRALLQGLESADFVSGSRFLRGARSEYRLRTFLSGFLNGWIRLLLRGRLTDYLFGFCVLRKHVLKNVAGKKIFHGFGDYYMRMLYYLERGGVRIAERPADHRRRRSGHGNQKLWMTAGIYFMETLKLAASRGCR